MIHNNGIGCDSCIKTKTQSEINIFYTTQENRKIRHTNIRGALAINWNQGQKPQSAHVKLSQQEKPLEGYQACKTKDLLNKKTLKTRRRAERKMATKTKKLIQVKRLDKRAERSLARQKA